MIPPDINVICIYGKPIDNSIEPIIAPRKLATLKIEAANVLARRGASFALKIILLFSNGVVPNVPKPNKKQMIKITTAGFLRLLPILEL